MYRPSNILIKSLLKISTLKFLYLKSPTQPLNVQFDSLSKLINTKYATKNP